jgi:hypothetical protein
LKEVIDEQFFSPRLPVSIVSLPNCDWEVYAMRGLLEAMNCIVTVHWIGTPSDFLKVLAQGETAPRYLLIAGHGDDEKGYYFGSYADFIDTSMLRDEYLPADVIAPIVNLPGCTVISSACAAGVEIMGRAFINTGRVNAYIACRDFPNADDMLVYVVNFFHSVLRKKISDREAWYRAMEITDQPDTYAISYFHPDGTEERYKQLTAQP